VQRGCSFLEDTTDAEGDVKCLAPTSGQQRRSENLDFVIEASFFGFI
jgi:hypothetical protein